MSKRTRKGRWLRCGAALALTTLGLWTCAAAEELVAKVEAEDGVLLGKAQIAATGTSVSKLEREGDGVEVTITVQEAGHYDIVVRQATVGGGVKLNDVSANGQFVGDLKSDSSSWNDSTVNYVWLEAGENAISITKSYGWIAIDYIGVRKSEPIPADVYDVEPVLINPNATAEAKALMTYLCDNYGKKVISGQQCQDGPFGLDNQAVGFRVNGGTYPAILGMDVGVYSPARARAGTESKVTDYAIEYWQEHGGITTLSWHWYADERYGSAFYTDSTTFNLKKAMNGSDPAGYQMLLDGIDAIAVQLKRLQDAGAPILWRPLHEASGGWFWWGASGPEPYIELYKLMYHRLTDYHGINNLIWVWNGQDAAWYPGDEYVDIIGEDIYPGEKVYTSQAARFLKALSYTDTRKIIALTENGCVPDVELMIRDNIMWSWWCTWEGEFVLKSQGFNGYSERYTEKAVLKRNYKHESVVTRKTLPDLTAYPVGE